MKMNYLKLAFTFFILFTLSSACRDSSLVQPEEKSATATPSLPATEIILPTATVENTIQVTPTPEVVKANPTPTMVPSPTPLSSPTFIALSPLDENLQTIIFTVSEEQGPEIYRVQVDEIGQKAGPIEQVNFPTNSRTRIYGLFPSPDGQKVAVGWVYGTGTTHIYLLDVASGQLAPLFGGIDIDQRATFLDWTPDGQGILVMGGTANPDLGNSAWLVDVNTQTYHDVAIKQTNEIPPIYDASFSPDGKTIVYAQREPKASGSEIWRINLNSGDTKLLYEAPNFRIENILWSPNGEYIIFNQWSISQSYVEFAIGELYIMNPDGNEKRLLTSTVIDYYNLFQPVWSTNSEQVAFIDGEISQSSKKANKLSSNLYSVNIFTNEIHLLTQFEDTQVIRPIWSPDNAQIAFWTLKNLSTPQLTSQIVSPNDLTLRELEVDTILAKTHFGEANWQSNNINKQYFMVWLP